MAHVIIANKSKIWRFHVIIDSRIRVPTNHRSNTPSWLAHLKLVSGMGVDVLYATSDVGAQLQLESL